MKKLIATLALLALAAPAFAHALKADAPDMNASKSTDESDAERADALAVTPGDGDYELLPGELVMPYRAPSDVRDPASARPRTTERAPSE